LVNGKDILHAALIGDVVVSLVERNVVLHLNGQREPALANLGIGSISNIQISIDSG
jgi:hypothetical protein